MGKDRQYLVPKMNEFHIIILHFVRLGPWFIKGICGLRKVEPKKDGGVHLEIKPFIPKNMTHAEMTYMTVWGRIKLNWKKNGNKVLFSAELPGAANADFVYGEKKAVWKGGNYEIEL